MKKLLCVLLGIILFAGLAAGCAGSAKDSYAVEAPAAVAGGSNGYYEAGEQMAPAEDAAYDMETAVSEEARMEYSGLGTEDTASLSSPDYGGRKVIRNLEIILETDDFDAQMDALLRWASELGGYVENSNVDGRKPEVYNDPGRNGYFVFRIPADKVDAFAENAKGCGTLISCNENAQDITSNYFDMETRLSVLRTQLERLTAILTETAELEDVIVLEQEIARVTLEIEELTTELRRYDGLISYATITVSLNELRLSQGPAAEKTVAQRIREDFTDSLYGVGTFFVDLFVWLIGALPVLIIIAAVAVGLFFLIRGGKKRREKRDARRAERLAKKAEAAQKRLSARQAKSGEETAVEKARKDADVEEEDKES